MDTPGAAAPWIVLGAVLGILVVAAAGGTLFWLLRRAVPSEHDTVAPTAAREPQDDLAVFLEFPPGSTGAPPPRTSGWAMLAQPAAVRGPGPEPAAPRRTGTLAVLLAGALALVLLIGAAAAMAVASRSADPPAPAAGVTTAASDPRAVAAELAFGGVVLERRPVGITATYPRMRLTTQDGRAVAEVELPTYNCLTAEAPENPMAAGCVPAGTEHAELASPQLTIGKDEDGAVRIAGRFPTRVHPNGSAPVPTGRSYELEVTTEPAGEVRRGQWLPAIGTLRLGDDTAATAGGADDRLRFG